MKWKISTSARRGNFSNYGQRDRQAVLPGQLKAKQAVAEAEVVELVARLSHREIHRKLNEWAAREHDTRARVTIAHGKEFVNRSYLPLRFDRDR